MIPTPRTAASAVLTVAGLLAAAPAAATAAAPDAAGIVFAGDRSGNLELYVGGADGTIAQRLTRTRADWLG